MTSSKMKAAPEALSKSQISDIKSYYIKNKNISAVELQEVFPSLLDALRNATGISDYRVICCDTISIWLLRASQIIQIDKSLSVSFSSLIDEDVSTFIFEYVIDFWNESGAPLGSSLKDMFLKMIVFLNCLGGNQNLYKRWLVQVLNTVSYTARVLYFMVETLVNQVPHASTLIIFDYPTFIDTAMSYMWSNALANPVGKSLQVIYRNYYTDVEKHDINWLHSWDKLVSENMKKDNLRKNIQNYLLPYLFKISSVAFTNYVKQLLKSEDENDLSSMLISLRIGQELGLVEDSFDGEDQIISISMLSNLISSEKEFFRIESFRLLVSTPKGSKPISPVILDLIMAKLDVFLVEENLEVRNEFASLFKKFILRLRDSTYSINRNSKKLLAKTEFVDEAKRGLALVDTNKAFLEKLIFKLNDNMKPGSSFQRCSLALKMMITILKSGVDSAVDKKHYEKLHMDYPFTIDIYGSTSFVRLLIDNITNDFEEVRNLSISILSMSSLSITDLLGEDQLSLIIERSFEMLGDLQGRTADAGAKVLQYVFSCGYQSNAILDRAVEKLIECVDLANKDLVSASYESNIHGYYSALNLILSGIHISSKWQYHDTLQKVISTIFDIWTLTKPVLTQDSPEGNLPENLQAALEPSKKHLETEFGPSTQVILSYSWRAVKESTALLASILSSFSDEVLFQENDITLDDIGELLIDQLSTIRHPGAFSSVYPTFLACSERCFRLGHETLPERWLQKNISLIEDKSHSITRRSGGLPFLITAILTAEFNSVKKSKKKNEIPRLFGMTYEKLYEIGIQPFDDSTGEETLELPQVHALNSVKHLFIESAISDVSRFYVDRSLDLALSRFSSTHWSVRNASVMLFTTLQNRLFGTKKIDEHHLSTISARLFFSRYKKLQSVLMNNFEQALNNESDVENLFPILTILSRLHSAPGYNPVLEFQPLLLRSLKNKHWKVREMAARALPSIVNDDCFYTQIEELLAFVRLNDGNELHGFLLAIKELLIRIHLRTGHKHEVVPSEVIKIFCESAGKILSSNYASATKFIEILDSVFEDSYQYKNIPVSLVNQLGNFYIQHDQLTVLDGSKQLCLSRLLTVLCKIHLAATDSSSLGDLLKLGLYSELYECQLSAIAFISLNVGAFSSGDITEFISIIWTILRSDVWSYVKAASLILLKDLLILSDQDEQDATEKINTLIGFTQDPAEDVKSTALQCLGAFASRTLDEAFFNRWFELVKSNSIDEASYHLRFAALSSCKSFLEHSLKSFSSKGYLETLVLFCQFLYDDDNEIRDVAADFLSKSVMETRFSMVSVEVEREFPTFLAKAADRDALNGVIFNLYIQKLAALNVEISAKSSLFNVEKSNFYKNIIDEFKFYLSILKETASEAQVTLIDHKLKSLSSKARQLLKYNDGILGVFRNEDYFNYLYVILLNLKEFELESDLKELVAAQEGIHLLLKDLTL